MIDASELTPDLIDELDEFMMSDHAPRDCMQLSDLDGFLTGVAVGPELIMPSEWIPTIWQGDQPEFKDMEQAERIMGIIMARYNEIIHLLDDEPGALEPILYEAPDGRMLAADWAEGFMDAFGLRVDAWDALFEDEDGRSLMGPIMAQLHDKDGKPFIEGSLEEMQEIREGCAQSLPYVIKDIHDFWKARRQPANPARKPAGKKVGRNDWEQTPAAELRAHRAERTPRRGSLRHGFRKQHRALRRGGPPYGGDTHLDALAPRCVEVASGFRV